MKAPRTHELSKRLAAAKVRDKLAFSHMFDHACELEEELKTSQGACELFAAGQESYLKEISELSRRNYDKGCILDHLGDILDLPNEATDDEIHYEAIRVIRERCETPTVDEEAEFHASDDADPPYNWISYETAKALEERAIIAEAQAARWKEEFERLQAEETDQAWNPGDWLTIKKTES